MYTPTLAVRRLAEARKLHLIPVTCKRVQASIVQPANSLSAFDALATGSKYMLTAPTLPPRRRFKAMLGKGTSSSPAISGQTDHLPGLLYVQLVLLPVHELSPGLVSQRGRIREKRWQGKARSSCLYLSLSLSLSLSRSLSLSLSLSLSRYVYVCIYIYNMWSILHYITLHCINYTTLYYYITLHYITLHYITLHYITLHYITLHYITLHYITLHYITSHHIRPYLHTHIHIYLCIIYVSRMILIKCI